MRVAYIHRKTRETDIVVNLTLDGTGTCDIHTTVGFLDHMLEQLCHHSLIDISLHATGDKYIDFHHLTEDTGIAIGEAVTSSLKDRKGITRYGLAYVPMDEALVRVVLDLSNRSYLDWQVLLPRAKLGDFDTELFKEWFQAFSRTAGAAVHVMCLYGENTHHIVEGCYKALARALRQAITIDQRIISTVPSTKGILSSIKNS